MLLSTMSVLLAHLAVAFAATTAPGAPSTAMTTTTAIKTTTTNATTTTTPPAVPTYAAGQPNPYHNLSVTYTLEWFDRKAGAYGGSIDLAWDTGAGASQQVPPLPDIYMVQFQLPDPTSKIQALDENTDNRFRYAAIGVQPPHIWHTFQPKSPLTAGNNHATSLRMFRIVTPDPATLARRIPANQSLLGPLLVLVTFKTDAAAGADTGAPSVESHQPATIGGQPLITLAAKATTAGSATQVPDPGTTTATDTTIERAVFQVRQQYLPAQSRVARLSTNPSRDVKKVAAMEPDATTTGIHGVPVDPQHDDSGDADNHGENNDNDGSSENAAAERGLPAEVIGAITGGVAFVGVVVVTMALVLRSRRSKQERAAEQAGR